jgi:hypothetical protein
LDGIGLGILDTLIALILADIMRGTGPWLRELSGPFKASAGRCATSWQA